MRILLTATLILFTLFSKAQIWVPRQVADMPMATSNNSVCEARINGGDYMFSFGGIDSSKVYSGIHQQCFQYNVITDSWLTIAPLPDTLGKIAGAASFVKDKIYIFGGYHVYNDGSELSSSRVHIYNPSANSYDPDGQEIPVATDDHAQVVWRDSLVYLIGGWSNTGNIPNVQIYNPSLDNWEIGTALPNNNQYKFFGAQATMLGDTIFYYGGAVTSNNFPALAALRIGVIDALAPTSINWLPVVFYPNHPLYRSVGITNPNNQITFLGGSAKSYNYNGLAYLGGAGVFPANEQIIYDPSTNQFRSDTSQQYPMDLRGLANVSRAKKYICGGMENDQLVTKKSFELTYMSTVNTSDFAKEIGLKVYPNPTKEIITISMNQIISEGTFSIINMQGQKIMFGGLLDGRHEISLESLQAGNYYLVLKINGQKIAQLISKHE